MLKFICFAGSLFLKRSQDGKVEVAVAPCAIAFGALGTIGCMVQQAEPFSQCVKTLWPVIGGIFNVQ